MTWRWGWHTPLYRFPMPGAPKWTMRLWGVSIFGLHFGVMQLHEPRARAVVAGRPRPEHEEQKMSDAIARCDICDWPLAQSMEDGCIAGNCSYRPREGTDEWFRIRERRARAAAARSTGTDTPTEGDAHE